MSKINLDMFVASLLAGNPKIPWGLNTEDIRQALKDQGLDYKDGCIVETYEIIKTNEDFDKAWNGERLHDNKNLQYEDIYLNPSEFDRRLNALLKEFERLPQEELASILEFYLKAVRKKTPFNLERLKEVSKSETLFEKAKFHIGDTVLWNGEEHTILEISEDGYDCLTAYIPFCQEKHCILIKK